MNKKGIFLLVAVIAVLGAAYFLWGNKTGDMDMTGAEQGEQFGTDMDGVDSSTTSSSDQSAAAVDENVKSFTVVGSNFSFSPTSLTVNKGDMVRITFKNDNGLHDFVLDEFNIKTAVINGGEEQVVEFVADKAGSFEYYCSVGQHRQMGMKGTLTVQE